MNKLEFLGEVKKEGSVGSDNMEPDSMIDFTLKNEQK